MSDEEKLKIIENILSRALFSRSKEIFNVIGEIHGQTGDETFVCSPVDLGILEFIGRK